MRHETCHMRQETGEETGDRRQETGDKLDKSQKPATALTKGRQDRCHELRPVTCTRHKT